MFRFRTAVRFCTIILLGALTLGCDDESTLTDVTTDVTPENVRTDSGGPQYDGVLSNAQNNQGSDLVPIGLGELADVLVSDAEAAQCHDVAVEGEININPLFTGIAGCGGGMGSDGIGKRDTIGPVLNNGDLHFFLATAQKGAELVEGSHPTYTVKMDDDFQDSDFDDVVLTVTLFLCNEIFPASTGDPVLDDPAVQQALLDALKESGSYNNTPSARKELMGDLYQNTVTGEITAQLQPVHPLANPCGTEYGGQSDHGPNDSLLAIYHTHPFASGDPAPKATGCDPNAHYVPSRNGGGSAQDWETVNFGSGQPMYIIDKDQVWRLDFGTSKRDWPQNPNRWDWSLQHCKA